MVLPETKFAELGVPNALVDVLRRQGIEIPFEVQEITIPDALAGRDVSGRAPTGSGKTLAFGLPLLAQLRQGKPRRPRGLILAPTRELAEQIRRELDPLAAAVGRSILSVYGGVGFGPQLRALRQGVDLLVACPGRLQDLVSQGALTLDQVDQVVIDEADRMADMGFLPVVQELLDLTSSKRQTLLFSATLGPEVEVLTRRYQQDPVQHQVGETEPDLSLVDHRFITTQKETKLAVAADLIEDAGPTMLFCRTRHGVDRVARQLKRVGVKAAWIHGGRSQSQRDAALSAFIAGRTSVLVATDVAARGIHVDGVACVIHYDPPADHKDYVHRSGRTARAGSSGLVVSLVNQDQRKAVAQLQKKVGLPKGEPEATPTVRPRELLSWVDQRPGKKGKPRSRSKPKAQVTSEQHGRHETDQTQGRDRSDKNGSRPPFKPGRKKVGQNNSAAKNTGTSKSATKSSGAKNLGSTNPGSKNGGAAKSVSSTDRPTRGSGPKRTGRKKPKQTTKRSGRARAKNHKQRRA